MKRNGCLVVAFSLMLLTACATHTTAPQRAVTFDQGSQRFSVHANDMTRGELLDQLQQVAGIKVRPQPARNDRLTLNADNLDADELLARLLPANSHYIARRGEREIASKTPVGQAKQGAVRETTKGLPTKGEPHAEPAIAGPMKMAVDGRTIQPRQQRPGPMVKAAPETLLARQANEPKQSLPARIPSESLRVTLEFQEGAAPRVLAVQAIEGGPPVERFVRGPFLYVVLDAGGQPLQYGSFQDPLEMHSYTPEGPHSILRAKSGTAGISLDRTKLDSASLQVIDARGMSLPRELNDEVVRRIVAQSKPVLVVPANRLMRALDQDTLK